MDNVASLLSIRLVYLQILCKDWDNVLALLLNLNLTLSKLKDRSITIFSA